MKRIARFISRSEESGVFVQIGNIEEALGVEPITDWDDDVPPVEYGQPEILQQFKDDLIAYVEEWSPQQRL